MLEEVSRSWGKVVSVQVWCEVGWAWSCLRNGLESLTNPSLCRHSIEPRHTYPCAGACTHTHKRTLPLPGLSKHPLKNKVSFKIDVRWYQKRLSVWEGGNYSLFKQVACCCLTHKTSPVPTMMTRVIGLGTCPEQNMNASRGLLAYKLHLF